jgi:hypothetical protein
MNLMEKYRRKFASTVKQGNQIMTPINELPQEVEEAYEERAAIMEHGGGLSKDQADKYAWCRKVCILTPGQRKLCEVVIPCPKSNNQPLIEGIAT